MDNDHHEQEHFSLMGMMLHPDPPEDEQIEELIRHANKEFSLAHRNIEDGFKRARSNLERAHIWNDLGTAWLSAISRVVRHWSMQDQGLQPSATTTADYEMLERFLLPELEGKA
jgi:hypothetical protein